MPKGDFKARPPPSLLRSTFSGEILGTAWQDEQPPILNMVSPFVRFGVCAGNAAAGTTLGSVKIQIAAKPKIMDAAVTNKNVRSLDTWSPPAQCRRDTRFEAALQCL